jgi:hypothetical protein
MANPRDYIIEPANVLGSYLGGVQAKEQNALLKAQQQNALAQGQQAEQGHNQQQQEALSDILTNGVKWADTPEKWTQLQQYAAQRGFAQANEYGFDKRDLLLAAGEQKKLAAGAQNPSSVQEFQYYQKLSPEDRAEYLRVKRAEAIKEIAGVQSRVGADGQVTPLGSLGAEANAAQVKAEAQARGSASGKATAEAASALPKSESQADNMLSVIDGILKDPALPGAVGLKGVAYLGGLKEKPIPGTKEAGFQARVDQLQGQAFLQAFESLKGGGQITEVEGRKATEAIGRLSTAQSESAFKAALNELKGIVIRAKSRARAAAKQAPAAGGWQIEEVP